jgi:repressor of nif and glnA expression
MVQDDIVKLLEKCEEALSSKEIAEKLIGKANYTAICRAIKKLNKYGEISSIKLDVKVSRRIYGKGIKQPISLFYVIQ